MDEREDSIQQQFCLIAVFWEMLSCWFKISMVKWPADPSDGQSNFCFCNMGTSPLYAVSIQKQDRFLYLTLPSRMFTSATIWSLLLAVLHHSGLVKPLCYSAHLLPMFSPNLSLPQGPVVCSLPYFSKKAGKYHASRKGNGVSLESLSVTRSENLRMESLLQGWKPACPKWLLFLSLSTALPSFVLTYVEGDDAAGQPLPGTWEIWTLLSQFRVCLVFGQLPKVSLLLFPSAQSGLCIWDLFLSFFICLICALITCWQMLFFAMCSHVAQGCL